VVDLDWSPAQKYAGLFLFEAVFWGLVLSLGFWLGFPGNGLFVGVIAVLNVIIGLAGYMVTREDGEFSGFRATRKEQLADEEIKELVEWALQFKIGYYPGRNEGGIEPAVAPSDDKEDAVRLYKYEFEPLNLSGKATVLIDMEQEISVDLGDDDSMENAWESIRNKKIVKSWLNTDYEAKVEKKRKSLGRSKSPMIRTVREGEDSRVVEERPAALPTPKNQSSSNDSSESSN
jgi:hypothetical protein